MTNIVIIGGSFGGLTTAYELRRKLSPHQATITLIAKDKEFIFVPSLPWVAMGSRKLSQISFDLAKPLNQKQVRFVHETLVQIDHEKKKVTTDKSEYQYDFLIIATGHRSANEAVEGLGPFGGPGHSLMSAPETEELGTALKNLLQDPGPVVIGCAPGASCIGPAYEFLFELDHLLRRNDIRHRVPITFVTPEPFVGHMGMGGAGTIRQLLENCLDERDITYMVSKEITKITKDTVELKEAISIPSVLSMIIPPLGGISAIASSPGLSNPKGFIPVDDYYRSLVADNVYCVGVAVAMPPVSETPVPVNFPKTGHMTEQMAVIATSDIISKVKGGRNREENTMLAARCVLDMGDKGVYMSVSPVRPPRNKIPNISEGRRWLVAKKAFERLYLFNARRGRRVPTTLGW